MSPTRGLPTQDAERSAVRYGTRRIPYTIRRSPRRKTVSIAVHPGFGVVVTAPTRVAVERLDGVVLRKAQWVVEKLQEASRRLPALSPREFVDGETFLYLGRQYRLRVRPGTASGSSVKQARGWFEVTVPSGAADRPRTVRKALIEWYRDHAAAHVLERVGFWSMKLNLESPRVLIRSQEKRWGSCDSTGTLRFNWRIIQAPMQLVDYVVAHELVHLLHKDHTPTFWRVLAGVVPDYDQRRIALKLAGRPLVW